ncbi:unnamed protein product [Colias eurytheme]|nr:unnamed protein product [Colias eurytheme]
MPSFHLVFYCNPLFKPRTVRSDTEINIGKDGSAGAVRERGGRCGLRGDGGDGGGSGRAMVEELQIRLPAPVRCKHVLGLAAVVDVGIGLLCLLAGMAQLESVKQTLVSSPLVLGGTALCCGGMLYLAVYIIILMLHLRRELQTA